MKKPYIDQDEDPSILTMQALVAARDAFNECLEKDGIEPAYWDIRFTAWILSTDDLKRLERVEIEREVKDK